MFSPIPRLYTNGLLSSGQLIASFYIHVVQLYFQQYKQNLRKHE